MTTLEILKAARELISDPKRWIQGEVALAANGDAIPPKDERAVCWCAVGAIERFAPTVAEHVKAVEALEEYVSNTHDEMIPEFNDSSRHGDVLELFDEVIAKLESGAT